MGTHLFGSPGMYGTSAMSFTLLHTNPLNDQESVFVSRFAARLEMVGRLHLQNGRDVRLMSSFPIWGLPLRWGEGE